jgi:hypothetical protein
MLTSEVENRSVVLNRIQRETQRLKARKKRLEAEHHPALDSDLQGTDATTTTVEKQQESATTTKSSAASASSSSLTKRQEPSRQPPSTSLVIDPSTGSYFEDPVPSNQMSSHLKSEHEAFKAR